MTKRPHCALPFVSRSPSTSRLDAVIETKRPPIACAVFGRDLIVARSSAAAGAVAAFKSYFISLFSLAARCRDNRDRCAGSHQSSINRFLSMTII